MVDLDEDDFWEEDESNDKLLALSGVLLGFCVYFIGTTIIGIPFFPALIGGLIAGVLSRTHVYLIIIGFLFLFLVMFHGLIMLSITSLVIGKLISTFFNIGLVGAGLLIGASIFNSDGESKALPDYRIEK